MTKPMPQDVQDDFSELLDAIVPFVQEMLTEHGEFFPFGALMNAAGEVEGQMADDDEPEPASEELIESLVESMRSEAENGSVRAAGICYDGQIELEGKKVDAIVIELEHQTGPASAACIPYRKVKGKYQFEDMVISDQEPRIFTK